MISRPATLLLTATLAVLPVALVPALAAATPGAPASDGPRATYVVTLRDQLPTVPPTHAHAAARSARARGAQDAVLDRLTGPAPTHVRHFSVGNVVSATVTAAQAHELSADPAVASVSRPRVLADPDDTSARPAGIRPAAQPAAAPAVQIPPATCTGTASQGQLEPQALQTISARSDDPAADTAAKAGYDGTGVTVGIIADVLDPDVTDFVRTDGTHVITRYVDVTGAGPNPSGGGGEMFGDASAIGAQGRTVYDLADGIDPTRIAYPDGHCYVRVVGVAPGAQITAINAGSKGSFDDIDLLQAVEYAVRTAHVDVLNESLGGFAVPDASTDNAVQAANAAATAAGTTVVVASGDAGVNSTIGSPAAQGDVIRVGASLTNRAYLQTGKGLSDDADDNPDHAWVDDNVSAISSSGATQEGRTVDLVAPGDSNWAVCKASPKYSECSNIANQPSSLQFFAGTSQACPLTSGTAALVIQAYRSTHGGTSPTPAVVKQIITATADDQRLSGAIQGAGRLDAARAVRTAASWPGTSAPAGAPAAVVSDHTQLTVGGAPGSVHRQTLSLTNVGGTAATATVRTRTAVQTGSTGTTVRLDPTATPVRTGEFGGVEVVRKRVPITVPSGTDHATVAIAWPHSAVRLPLVFLSLFAPDGSFVADSNPQSTSNPETGAVIGPQYSQLTVRTPDPGRYLAEVYTFAQVGFAGTVHLGARFFEQQAVATPVPAATVIAPGQSRTVEVPVTVPTRGGDTEQDVVVSTGDARFAVPLVVRSELPVATGPARFGATIYGGNGRPDSPVQSATYSMLVPGGRRDLSVDLTSPCGCALEALLVDPYGQIRSDVTNNDPRTAALVPGLSLTAAAPTAGRWRLVVTVNDITGTATTSSFTGTAALDVRKVTARGLPNATSRTLTRDKTAVVPVTITNTSPMPMGVEIDPRLTTSVTTDLVTQSGGHRLKYPNGGDEVLVPFDTTALSLSLTAPDPVRGGLEPQSGAGISRVSPAGGTADSPARTGMDAAHGVTPGPWQVYADAADATSATVHGTATYRATVTTAAFDRTVTTPNHDGWLGAVDATAPDDTPLILTPGATATIAVRIRPTARAGTQVTGTLLVFQTPGQAVGSVLARVPYRYTVADPSAAAPNDNGKPRALADTGVESLVPLGVLATVCLVLGLALSLAGRRVVAAGRHRRVT